MTTGTIDRGGLTRGFTSDNIAGAAPEVLTALTTAAAGQAALALAALMSGHSPCRRARRAALEGRRVRPLRAGTRPANR